MINAKKTYSFTTLHNAFNLIKNGHLDVFLKELKHRLYSQTLSFGLKRDLQVKFKTPESKINIAIRPLKEEDVSELLKNSPVYRINPRIIANQQSIIDANIPTCYVAVTKDDKPCYMQWLIGYEDRDVITKHFRGVFPMLKKSEALLEGAYSNPVFRGLRIMPAAMAEIAKKAESLQSRWVITFVDIQNIPSLKGCKRAGFEPYVLRKSEWFFFRYKVTFNPIPEELLEEYYQQMSDKHHLKMKTRGNNQKSQSLEQLS